MKFQKGHIPWNKGLKGIHLSPSTEFTPERAREIAKKTWKDEEIRKKRIEGIKNRIAEKGTVGPWKLWTKEEDDILRKYWGKIFTSREIKEKFLPHRSVKAIQYRAEKLGLKASKEIKRKIASIAASKVKHPPTCNCAACKTKRGEMEFPKAFTKPEIAIISTLAEIGIKFKTQYPIKLTKNYTTIVDIAIPEKKVVINIDGCFWHCCPKHFPVPKTEPQKKVYKLDKLRYTLLEQKGWKVIRIWECEVSKYENRDYLREYLSRIL